MKDLLEDLEMVRRGDGSGKDTCNLCAILFPWKKKAVGKSGQRSGGIRIVGVVWTFDYEC